MIGNLGTGWMLLGLGSSALGLRFGQRPLIRSKSLPGCLGQYGRGIGSRAGIGKIPSFIRSEIGDV